VATSDSNEIYRLDLQASRIAPMARIPDASKLGPVAFDEAKQQIYVADVASGKVYQYSIPAKSSKVFVSGLSTPTALVFDAETNQLFVADPGQRAIFVVDTRASKPAIAQFAAGPLRAPYGMTLISEGRVAVADYNANSIFVFSGKGDLLFRFPAAE
jgi:DNA-binding beta-propeller fold protein YncE